jgi:beta-lactamase regulating signal transducer with metallopeptidase domain
VSFAATLGPIPGWIFDLSPGFLGHLIDPALRSLAVAVLAGLVLIVARNKSLSFRFSIWRVVVCAALAMPLLASVMPPLAVSLPVLNRLPQFIWSEGKPDVPGSVLRADALAQLPIAAVSNGVRNVTQKSESAVRPAQTAATITHPTKIPWPVFVSGIYAGVAFFLTVRFIIGWFLSRRLRKLSRPILDPSVNARFAAHARAAHLRSIPRLAESDRLAVPLTCGVLRPAVLFPGDWRTWDADTLNAVIVHEMSHVARRDALTERLALIHRIVFWFSPLAWWLRRHLADLAEEASDQAALAAGAEPTKYAEILLGFFNDLSSVSHRAEWQGVAMAQAGRAEKRLERILKGRIIVTTRIQKSFVALVVFASVPVIMVSASLQPQRLGKQILFSPYPSRVAAAPKAAQQPSPAAVSGPAGSATPAGPAKPVVSAAPLARATPAAVAVAAPAAQISEAPAPRAFPVRVASAPQPQAAMPAPAPVPPAPVSVAPQAPTPPPPPALSAGPHPGYSYSFSTDSGSSYAIISGKSESMSGSFESADFAQIEALRKKINGDFIWFERDGKSYVITDPETVKRATAAFAEQSELGRQQGELGGREGALGEAQGALGEEQGVLGEQMEGLRSNLENMKIELPDMSAMTAQLQELTSKSWELSEAISQKDMDEMRTNVAQMQKDIAAAQEKMDQAQIRDRVAQSLDSAAIEAAMKQARTAIDEQMAKFAAEQSKLGVAQAELGREQTELGREQAKAAAKAEAEIKAIINESLSRGTAQPAPK